MRIPRIVPPERLKFLTDGGTVPEWLAPLEDPEWVQVRDARHMHADDPVIVVTPNERSYVLPWWVMKNHHVANLTLEEQPVTVTLCELCAASAAYDARIDDELRTFQVVGAWNGTHVIADHETQTIWSSFSGFGIWGYHRHDRLRQLPMYQAAWGDCVVLDHGSVVVEDPAEPRGGHGGSCRPRRKNQPLTEIPRGIDQRVPSNDLVLGVEAGDLERAYVLDDLLERGGVVNDTLGGIEIVALAGPGDYTAIAFERTVDGRTLLFRADEGAVIDDATESRWDLRGYALSGPLAGTRLTFVPSHIEKWFSWAAYHPRTDLGYRGPSAARA
jgi:hypothetical protein